MSWLTACKGKPTISQPSRTDATKVMVDWSKILKNPDCADSFTLLVWADGTQQIAATKFAVDKNTKSKIVDVQPCVGYRFAVESHEKNTLGTKTVTSGDQVFKSVGAPSSLNLDASRFHVTYHWDPVQKVVDLRMASITIPREMLPGASCLDYIQVTGTAVRGSSGSGSSSPSRARSFSWGHLGQAGYNPNIQVGAAATLPATTGAGSYSNAVRGPTATTWQATTSRPGSPTGNQSPSLTPPISSPHYANSLPRATGGAAHTVGPIRVQPPFLNPLIEIKVPVQDCAEYNFEIKLFAPSAKEVGKVSNVRLPPLADVPGYVPPPVTSVMSISYGTNGKPVYGVKTASGVTAACLPAYFEAYDAYTHRLENEVSWQIGEGNRAQSLVSNSRNTLESSQEELLRKSGCVCTSPHIEFSTTDATFLKDYGNQFGHYHFEGMHGGRPFYKQMPHDHAGSHSHGSTAPTGVRPPITTTTARPATPKPPMFIFWDEKHKQWMFGPVVGSTSKIEFGSIENSLSKCPADPPSTGNWQYKSSVLGRWKKSAELKVECEIHL